MTTASSLPVFFILQPLQLDRLNQILEKRIKLIPIQGPPVTFKFIELHQALEPIWKDISNPYLVGSGCSYTLNGARNPKDLDICYYTNNASIKKIRQLVQKFISEKLSPFGALHDAKKYFKAETFNNDCAVFLFDPSLDIQFISNIAHRAFVAKHEGFQIRISTQPLCILKTTEGFGREHELKEAWTLLHSLSYEIERPQEINNLWFRLTVKITQGHYVKQEVIKAALQTLKMNTNTSNPLQMRFIRYQRKHFENHQKTGRLFNFLNSLALCLFANDRQEDHLELCKHIISGWRADKDAYLHTFSQIVFKSPDLLKDFLALIHGIFLLSLMRRSDPRLFFDFYPFNDQLYARIILKTPAKDSFIPNDLDYLLFFQHPFIILIEFITAWISIEQKLKKLDQYKQFLKVGSELGIQAFLLDENSLQTVANELIHILLLPEVQTLYRLQEHHEARFIQFLEELPSHLLTENNTQKVQYHKFFTQATRSASPTLIRMMKIIKDEMSSTNTILKPTLNIFLILETLKEKQDAFLSPAFIKFLHKCCLIILKKLTPKASLNKVKLFQVFLMNALKSNLFESSEKDLLVTEFYRLAQQLPQSRYFLPLYQFNQKLQSYTHTPLQIPKLSIDDFKVICDDLIKKLLDASHVSNTLESFKILALQADARQLMLRELMQKLATIILNAASNELKAKCEAIVNALTCCVLPEDKAYKSFQKYSENSTSLRLFFPFAAEIDFDLAFKLSSEDNIVTQMTSKELAQLQWFLLFKATENTSLEHAKKLWNRCSIANNYIDSDPFTPLYAALSFLRYVTQQQQNCFINEIMQFCLPVVQLINNNQLASKLNNKLSALIYESTEILMRSSSDNLSLLETFYMTLCPLLEKDKRISLYIQLLEKCSQLDQLPSSLSDFLDAYAATLNFVNKEKIVSALATALDNFNRGDLNKPLAIISLIIEKILTLETCQNEFQRVFVKYFRSVFDLASHQKIAKKLFKTLASFAFLGNFSNENKLMLFRILQQNLSSDLIINHWEQLYPDLEADLQIVYEFCYEIVESKNALLINALYGIFTQWQSNDAFIYAYYLKGLCQEAHIDRYDIIYRDFDSLDVLNAEKICAEMDSQIHTITTLSENSHQDVDSLISVYKELAHIKLHNLAICLEYLSEFLVKICHKTNDAKVKEGFADFLTEQTKVFFQNTSEEDFSDIKSILKQNLVIVLCSSDSIQNLELAIQTFESNPQKTWSSYITIFYAAMKIPIANTKFFVDKIGTLYSSLPKDVNPSFQKHDPEFGLLLDVAERVQNFADPRLELVFLMFSRVLLFMIPKNNLTLFNKAEKKRLENILLKFWKNCASFKGLDPFLPCKLAQLFLNVEQANVILNEPILIPAIKNFETCAKVIKALKRIIPECSKYTTFGPHIKVFSEKIYEGLNVMIITDAIPALNMWIEFLDWSEQYASAYGDLAISSPKIPGQIHWEFEISMKLYALEHLVNSLLFFTDLPAKYRHDMCTSILGHMNKSLASTVEILRNNTTKNLEGYVQILSILHILLMHDYLTSQNEDNIKTYHNLWRTIFATVGAQIKKDKFHELLNSFATTWIVYPMFIKVAMNRAKTMVQCTDPNQFFARFQHLLQQDNAIELLQDTELLRMLNPTTQSYLTNRPFLAIKSMLPKDLDFIVSTEGFLEMLVHSFEFIELFTTLISAKSNLGLSKLSVTISFSATLMPFADYLKMFEGLNHVIKSKKNVPFNIAFEEG